MKTTVDAQALSDYLSLMYVPGTRSIFSQISKVEPVTTLTWQDNITHRWRTGRGQLCGPGPLRTVLV